MSKATNAPDTDKASTFRLGNGVPLQGFGLLVDGPRNQGVAHYGKQDGRRKLHHPGAVGSKFQCSCLGFIGKAWLELLHAAYVIFLRFHVFILFFSNIVHVSHSSFTPQQQLRHSSSLHRVPWIVPYDGRRGSRSCGVPLTCGWPEGAWQLVSRNGELHGFSGGSLLCKKDRLPLYAVVTIKTAWLQVLSRCLSSRIRALTVVYTFIKARNCPWFATCLTASCPQAVHSWGAICGESRLFAEGRTISAFRLSPPGDDFKC